MIIKEEYNNLLNDLVEELLKEIRKEVDIDDEE